MKISCEIERVWEIQMRLHKTFGPKRIVMKFESQLLSDTYFLKVQKPWLPFNLLRGVCFVVFGRGKSSRFHFQQIYFSKYSILLLFRLRAVSGSFIKTHFCRPFLYVVCNWEQTSFLQCQILRNLCDWNLRLGKKTYF